MQEKEIENKPSECDEFARFLAEKFNLVNVDEGVFNQVWTEKDWKDWKSHTARNKK